MTNKKQSLSVIKRNGLKWLAVAVLLAAFSSALWVNFGLRAPVEARNKTVGLLVDYDELKRIADGSYDIEFQDMLRKAALSGATGLVVRERILSDWEIAGDILVFSGGQLNFQLENQNSGFAASSSTGQTIMPEKTYVLTKDPLVYEQIFSLLEAKRRYPEPIAIQGYLGIVTSLHSVERANLGLGFPLAQLELAAAEGYQIIPRLRNWEPVTEANLAEVFRWVSKIPNLAAIGFNEQTVPGEGTDQIIQDRLAEAMAPLQKPLVSFEFYDQIGLAGLAARLDNELLRAHAIAENELRKYVNLHDAMNRYGLAATERNIRYIYLRFQGLINPAASMLNNMELIEYVRDGLTDEGLRVGNPEPMQAYSIPIILLFLSGAGVIAAGGWLAALAAEPFFAEKKWRIPYFILMALGCLALAGLLIVAPILARKLTALAASIIFPCLGVVLVLNHRNKELTGIKSLLRAICQLLMISAVTMFGAIIMSALLAEPAFMLKLDNFVGVKIAHVVPLFFIPFILWLREEDWFGLLSGTARSSVRMWQLGVCIVLIAGVAVYILRTGNDNPEAVFQLELTARQMLSNLLGVRPRTTEFLIGHPLMLVLLYFGYRFNMFPVLIVGLMGQISLMNTYAHIHTPIMVSLHRSGHGLWIGALIGIFIIAILELILRRLRIVESKVPIK